MTPRDRPHTGEGRYFAHRLFGLCGKDSACPPAQAAAASPKPQPSTPRWRGAPPQPRKAA
jgi:hypothetical protein